MILKATHKVTVSAHEWLTPRMARLTLAGPSLVGMESRPAQDIEVLLTDADMPVKRRYTIRHARPDVGEIDVDVLIHGDSGPGSVWATVAQPGSVVEFVGPKGKLELLEADWHLLVGDEAALPAIAALAEALGPGAASVVLMEADSVDDELPIAASSVTWLHRTGAKPGTTSLLADALAALDTPEGNGRAYMLGESHTVHGLRAQLVRHGIPDERAFVKGYWNREAVPRRDRS
jgi:NADPH-dependent ferric siderophore reductase